MIAFRPHQIARFAALCTAVLTYAVVALSQNLHPEFPPGHPANPIVAPDGAPALRAAKVRMILAGDSTVTDGSGWGRGFANCLNSNVELTNLARNGRSSKSYIAEGLWKKCLDEKPDYVLIQFGHNDQRGKGADRETDPETTYRQYMNEYIDEARAAGIKPVLVTSLSRRQWGDDGKIHSNLDPNVKVVKEIAAEKHVPLIDLHARSIELYEKLGKEACDELAPKKDDGTIDNTHLNAKGSEVIGPIVAEELEKAVPELAPCVKH
jgi:lysophospholipase L1-like esterase